MLIFPREIHANPERARIGITLAAEALGLVCKADLSSQWVVNITGKERKAFIELARECAEKGAE